MQNILALTMEVPQLRQAQTLCSCVSHTYCGAGGCGARAATLLLTDRPALFFGTAGDQDSEVLLPRVLIRSDFKQAALPLRNPLYRIAPRHF